MNLTFGQAIEAVKEGKLIARSGWNGKGMFVFQRPEDTLSVSFIVDKVKSLPESLKHYYKESTFTQYESDEIGAIGKKVEPSEVQIKFTAYLCMKAADGTIVNGWLSIVHYRYC